MSRAAAEAARNLWLELMLARATIERRDLLDRQLGAVRKVRALRDEIAENTEGMWRAAEELWHLGGNSEAIKATEMEWYGRTHG